MNIFVSTLASPTHLRPRVQYVFDVSPPLDAHPSLHLDVSVHSHPWLLQPAHLVESPLVLAQMVQICQPNCVNVEIEAPVHGSLERPLAGLDVLLLQILPVPMVVEES